MCLVTGSGVQRKNVMSAFQPGLADSDECTRTDAQACSVWLLTPTCQPGAATSARLLGAEEAGLLNAHVKGMLP